MAVRMPRAFSAPTIDIEIPMEDGSVELLQLPPIGWISQRLLQEIDARRFKVEKQVDQYRAKLRAEGEAVSGVDPDAQYPTKLDQMDWMLEAIVGKRKAKIIADASGEERLWLAREWGLLPKADEPADDDGDLGKSEPSSTSSEPDQT